LKSRLATLLILLTFPVAADAHSEIFFPKLFSPAELPTSGFVLLNPDPITATVSIYLLSAEGAIVASTTITIPAGGQFARLGSDLFPNATRSGWVYVLNDTEGMQAFWLTYNASLTAMDGAEAVSYDSIGTDQVIPLVAGRTELNIINTNFLNVPATIQLFGSNGLLAPAATRTLPAAGAFQSQISDLFPTADMTQARYLRVGTAVAAIASSAVIRDYLVPFESLVVNAVNVIARSEMVFPHVISGSFSGANYTTVLGITNLSNTSQTVTISFNSDTDAAITVSRSMQAGESIRETAHDIFNLAAGFHSGWVRVAGTAAITGFAGYADTVAGGLAVVPAAAAQPKLFFSHIANGAPQWQTGLALLNAGSSRANVEVYAMSPSGGLLGGALNVETARLTLEPGKKTAKLLQEVIPQTLGVNGGFVFVSSDVPVHGIELFYTQDLKVLSNVAAGNLVPGVAYTPPAP